MKADRQDPSFCCAWLGRRPELAEGMTSCTSHERALALFKLE